DQRSAGAQEKGSRAGRTPGNIRRQQLRPHQPHQRLRDVVRHFRATNAPGQEESQVAAATFLVGSQHSKQLSGSYRRQRRERGPPRQPTQAGPPPCHPQPPPPPHPPPNPPP